MIRTKRPLLNMGKLSNKIPIVLENYLNSFNQQTGHQPITNSDQNYPPNPTAFLAIRSSSPTHFTGRSPISSFGDQTGQSNIEQEASSKSTHKNSNEEKCNACVTLNSECSQCVPCASATKRLPVDNWKIKANEITSSSDIYSGTFGTVHHGYWHGDVALKKLKNNDLTQDQLRVFMNEVAILERTRHENIVLFMGYVLEEKLLVIVTQWCKGSTLYSHLHTLEHRFDLWQCMKIAQQIARGMDYLHAKDIAHLDLKSKNIFLQEDYTVKIGDFGN